MNKFDALHDDRTLRWCKYRYPDDINSGEFTFDCTKDGFTWTLPSDKPQMKSYLTLTQMVTSVKFKLK